MSLEAFKIVAEIIQSLATAGGILAAGVWTYFVFAKRRQQFPRANVTHDVYHYRIPDGRTILRLAARITNTGEALVCIRYARTRVQQFSPLPDHIGAMLAPGANPPPAEECELRWTVLGAREWRTEGEIEPGESETLPCDFVIPADVDRVLVYTYVTNHAKRTQGIGWSDTVVVSFGEVPTDGK